jgi:hypothetical protein
VELSPRRELRGDDLEQLGFEVGTLPGGTYLHARLQGEPPAVYDKIPSTVRELVKQAAVRRVEADDRVLPQPRRDRSIAADHLIVTYPFPL